MYAIRSYYVDPRAEFGDGEAIQVVDEIDFRQIREVVAREVGRAEREAVSLAQRLEGERLVGDAAPTLLSHPLVRITSYNVCYTKLLRSFPRSCRCLADSSWSMPIEERTANDTTDSSIRAARKLPMK